MLEMIMTKVQTSLLKWTRTTIARQRKRLTSCRKNNMRWIPQLDLRVMLSCLRMSPSKAIALLLYVVLQFCSIYYLNPEFTAVMMDYFNNALQEHLDRILQEYRCSSAFEKKVFMSLYQILQRRGSKSPSGLPIYF